MSQLDGVLLTGSYSNMEPHHYGDEPNDDSEEQRDPARDSMALALIEAALEMDMPLFTICRGFEELNVALGGTLHQDLGAAGFDIHTENADDPLEIQYGPRHGVEFAGSGLMHDLAGASGARVNSVHGQGIATVGAGLSVEALAEDGLVEAIAVEGARFAVGVQWHPEWRVESNRFSMRLFAEFGSACRRYRKSRE